MTQDQLDADAASVLPRRTLASLPPVQSQSLAQWLRVLWDASPPLHFDGETPFIQAGTVHLPPSPSWLTQRAAAAHAVAHLVYSPPRFHAGELGPIARALLGLLEDARVETLACRELPGLARLWRPLHQATPGSLPSVEGLMARLARALADPAYVDPHPWIEKGRKLFFIDARLCMPALRTAAELRQAALLLGHDIGQMRLPFNVTGYRPTPYYRDDHRWMWDADSLAPVQIPAPKPTGAAASEEREPPLERKPVVEHPEWDRLIGRLRPAWTQVIETPMDDPMPVGGPPEPPSAMPTIDAALTPALRRLVRPGRQRRLDADGDVLDLDALIEEIVAVWSGQAAAGRVHARPARRPAACAVWVLVDRSASTATSMDTAGPAGADATHLSARSRSPAPPTLLEQAAQVGATLALALRSINVPCTIASFNSHGRHRVCIGTTRLHSDGGAAALLARLGHLKSAGSTRLGAAIRHATRRLKEAPARQRHLFVLSDGDAHDIDVHDARYLVDDARHAVRGAQRAGIGVSALLLGQEDAAVADAARTIFGRAWVRLDRSRTLSAALGRLLP